MTKITRRPAIAKDSGLIQLDSFVPSSDASKPQADITNASYLFGDPSDYGDIDVDDYDDNGDPVDYGDPSPLAAYMLMSGDPKSKVGRFIKRHKAPIAFAGGAAGGYATAEAIRAIIAKRKKKIAARRMLEQAALKQSLQRSRDISRSIGPLKRMGTTPFFSLKGAKMNSSPIDPNETFVTDMFKQMLDRQNMDTPFLQETAQGVFGGVSWTITASGTVASRLFTGLILQFGTNMLNAAPATVISITMTIPTFDGPLVVATTPFILTYEKGFDVRFLFFPWRLVANKPLPVLGSYNNANPITIVVTGPPAASAVNLVVPGSLHPWTSAMRNALIQG